MFSDQEPQRLQKKLAPYLDTLHKMAQQDLRFRDLTPAHIEATWMRLPNGEQRGILLLAQLQEFFWKLKPRTAEEQRAVIERDIPRKGPDSKFGEYTRKMVDLFEQMKKDGDIAGSWYISQSRKTQLEEDLDSSGVDWVVQKTDGVYVLVQSGTRPGDARDKMRHLDRDYGPKFAGFRFIGTMPMLDDAKNIPPDEELKRRVHNLLADTRGFTENVLASAFPS